MANTSTIASGPFSTRYYVMHSDSPLKSRENVSMSDLQSTLQLQAFGIKRIQDAAGIINSNIGTPILA